jgi:hypothetical protein
MVVFSFGAGFSGVVVIDMSSGEEAIALEGKTIPNIEIAMTPALKYNNKNLNFIVI